MTSRNKPELVSFLTFTTEKNDSGYVTYVYQNGKILYQTTPAAGKTAREALEHALKMVPVWIDWD